MMAPDWCKTSTKKVNQFVRLYCDISMNTLASIIGSGIAGTLIAYPIVYYALANHYKASLSNLANLGLFLVTVPVVGIAEVAFGGGSDTLGGFLVLFGAPLLLSFIVIGSTFKIRTEKAKARADAGPFENRIASHLRRFSRPAERVAFVFLVLGLCLFLIGLVGFWFDRGFYWSELKYDLREIFLEDISYRRHWSQWCARIGLVLTACGYAVAYHHERIVAPLLSYVGGFVRWLRTGR